MTKIRMKMKKRLRHLCFDTGGGATDGVATASDCVASSGFAAAAALSTEGGGTFAGVDEEERFFRCLRGGVVFFFARRPFAGFETGFFVAGVFFFFRTADDGALVLVFMLL